MVSTKLACTFSNIIYTCVSNTCVVDALACAPHDSDARGFCGGLCVALPCGGGGPSSPASHVSLAVGQLLGGA